MTGLQTGMIVSNEPGYYEDHSFGIRIEVKLMKSECLSVRSYYFGLEPFFCIVSCGALPVMGWFFCRPLACYFVLFHSFLESLVSHLKSKK